MEPYRTGGQRHIPAGIYVIIAVPYRRYLEIPVASRDERVFVYLAALRTSRILVRPFRHLGVVHFHVRREGHFRSLKQGDISLSLDSHHKRCRLMGHKGILAQGCRYAELPDTAAECRRRTRRKRRDIDRIRLRHHPLAYGPLVLEETVEYACPSCRRDTDIHDAHEFRRVNGDCSRLLRNQHIFPQDRGVVDIPVHILPLEFDICGSLHLLAPETVESGETGILESGDVHPLVQFQRSLYRLSHNHISPVEGKTHEKVIIRYCACRGRSTGAPLVPACGR